MSQFYHVSVLFENTLKCKIELSDSDIQGFDLLVSPPILDNDRAQRGSNPVAPTIKGEGVRSFRSDSFFIGLNWD